MPLRDDIATLESSIQERLRGIDNYPGIVDLPDRYRAAILEAVGDAADPLNVDVRTLVEEVFADELPDIEAQILEDMQRDVERVIDETQSFYSQIGADMPDLGEAIAQSRRITQLSNTFEENFATMNDDLRETTIQAMQDQFATGQINRDALSESIQQRGDVFAHHARTNSRLMVSGHNRTARSEARQSAGLRYGYYYGHIRATTRMFCRSCMGQVFDADQIAAMSNGHNLDVELFAGGYNCIHSWVWIDLDWDEEMKSLYEEQRRLITQMAESVEIQVFE